MEFWGIAGGGGEGGIFIPKRKLTETSGLIT